MVDPLSMRDRSRFAFNLPFSLLLVLVLDLRGGWPALPPAGPSLPRCWMPLDHCPMLDLTPLTKTCALI